MFVLRASYKKNNYSRCGGPYNFVDLYVNWNENDRKSQLFDNGLLPVKYVTDQYRIPADFSDAPNYTVLCSEKLISCFPKEMIQNEVELIPAEIYHKRTKNNYSSWILHVLNVCSIIDNKKSILSEVSFRGFGKQYLKIVLDAKEINKKFNIYKDVNLNSEYFISDEVATKLINDSISGVEILNIEDYYNRLYAK